MFVLSQHGMESTELIDKAIAAIQPFVEMDDIELGGAIVQAIAVTRAAPLEEEEIDRLLEDFEVARMQMILWDMVLKGLLAPTLGETEVEFITTTKGEMAFDG